MIQEKVEDRNKFEFLRRFEGGFQNQFNVPLLRVYKFKNSDFISDARIFKNSAPIKKATIKLNKKQKQIRKKINQIYRETMRKNKKSYLRSKSNQMLKREKNQLKYQIKKKFHKLKKMKKTQQISAKKNSNSKAINQWRSPHHSNTFMKICRKTKTDKIKYSMDNIVKSLIRQIKKQKYITSLNRGLNIKLKLKRKKTGGYFPLQFNINNINIYNGHINSFIKRTKRKNTSGKVPGSFKYL